MRLADAGYVIVQAGGRGRRLGPLTANKPKCLLSVDGEPLLYRLFRQLPAARFIIIGDYRFETLRNYLAAVPPGVPYQLLHTSATGTLAGLRDAVAGVGNGSSFLIVWSDLFFGDLATEVPGDRAVIGLSDTFPCRWSASPDGQLAEVPSSDRGVAGVFLFPAREFLPELPRHGEFVEFLQQSALPLTAVVVPEMREFGTAQAVQQYQGDRAAVRFFNYVELGAREVVKRARLDKYRHLIDAEIRWYDTVGSLGFRHIPEGDTVGGIRDDQRPVAGRLVFPGPQLALAYPGPAWPQGAVYQRDRAPGSLCRLVRGRPELRGRLIDQWRQEADVSRDRGLIHVEDLCPDFLNDD